jgi:acetyltransferase
MRVNTIDELVECAEYLTHAQVPAGPRLGAITFSGGLKGLLLEGAERNGLTFPALAAPTLARLGEILGVGTSLGNPLDAGFAALSSAEAYFTCIDILLADPAIDLLLVQEELPLKEGQNAKAGNLRTVDRMVVEGSGKPVAVVSMASYMYSDFTRSFREGFPHLPVLHEVDKALKAAGHVGRYGARLGHAPPSRTAQPLPPAAPALLATAASTSAGLRVMGEAASKILLAPYGLTVPAEQVATDAQAAVAAAERIGYPVVLKLVSDDVQHKSDVGGVLVGLENAQDVSTGFTRIRESLERLRPGAHFGGVLVAEQVSGGLELVLGVHRDPEVGLVTMFGAGGVLLELQKDVAFGPVPLDARTAADMIDRTMAGKLLEGYRGAPKRDRAAVAAALIGLSHLAQDLGDRLVSIDINPLVALPEGQGAHVLDALVVLRDG